MQYYQRLKEMRTDGDLRQQEIADYLEISQTHYSMYELGKKENFHYIT